MVADPPYNVPIDDHVGGRGSIKHREFAMASGEMAPQQFVEFLTAACAHFARHSVDGSLHYLFMDWRHSLELLTAARCVYTEHKNTCVWAKTNAGMGSFYRSQHELVHVFKNGLAPHINNIELGAHGRNRSNLWTYQGINSFGRQRNQLLALHPTVKPVDLIVDVIKDCTLRGDLVLDPFAGSGTTVIAAERTGRRAALLEIDPCIATSLYAAGKTTPARPRSACGPAVALPSEKRRQPPCLTHGRFCCLAPRAKETTVSDDEKAGYSRPPLSGRFKPGQSGNPKGRPKGSRNLKTDLTSMMKRRVQIREDGQQRMVSRQELVLLRLFERAAKGDTKACTQLFSMIMKFEPKEASNVDGVIITEHDQEIIADFLRRHSKHEHER